VLAALDRGAGQVARELLVGEAAEHLCEHLLLRAQQRNPVD